MRQFDYIIVGGGTAGCLLANRLSANPRNDVLLLEAGGNDRYLWIHVPVGYLYTMNNPRTDWCMKTQPDAGLNGRSLNYPRGRVIGGSSAINGMIYMRGQAADYDAWAAQGNAGWSWEEVLPFFLRHEDHAFIKNRWHAQGGEWRIEHQRLSWEILGAFRDAAAECGIPPTDDFNAGDNEGCGYFHVNQRNGVRVSAARAFLHPIKKRPNLTVLLGAEVTEIGFVDKTATSVSFIHQGSLETVQVGQEVVLAAGAVHSPMLLQRAGIGDSADLSPLGITPLHHLAGVGKNLQDHLQLRTVFRVNNTKTLNEKANRLLGRLAMGLEYIFTRRGPLSMAPSQLGCFAKSSANQPRANLEYHVQPLSTEKLGDPLHPFPAITASVCNLRPESRGYVRLSERNDIRSPIIVPNYLSTPGDQQVAADSIRLTRKIMSASALGKYGPEELLPGPDKQDDEALFAAAGQIGTTIFHPVGTCRMGPVDDTGAVVDERLRVHGIDRLRVVDASIMPNITSGNTSSPTLMIAEKASELMLEDQAARAQVAS